MEAARIASLRGHDVTLWEKQDELGGALKLAELPPHRHEFGELKRWLIDQLPKVGVQVELERKADPESVEEFSPDVLIAATGAYPKTPEHIHGWNLPNTTNVYDALSGRSELGERVLVLGYDTQAIEFAAWASAQGKRVFLVSGAPVQAWEDPIAALANDKNSFTGRYVLMNSTFDQFEFMPFMMIKSIKPGGVILSKTGEQHPCTTHVRIGELEDQLLQVDSIVIHMRLLPVLKWMNGIGNVVPEIIKVGDCLEPRKAIDAMVDGARVGREV
jgi:2,4-dienoyl-CoA reductase (NADPH2)